MPLPHILKTCQLVCYLQCEVSAWERLLQLRYPLLAPTFIFSCHDNLSHLISLPFIDKFCSAPLCFIGYSVVETGLSYQQAHYWCDLQLVTVQLPISYRTSHFPFLPNCLRYLQLHLSIEPSQYHSHVRLFTSPYHPHLSFSDFSHTWSGFPFPSSIELQSARQHEYPTHPSISGWYNQLLHLFIIISPMLRPFERHAPIFLLRSTYLWKCQRVFTAQPLTQHYHPAEAILSSSLCLACGTMHFPFESFAYAYRAPKFLCLRCLTSH